MDINIALPIVGLSAVENTSFSALQYNHLPEIESQETETRVDQSLISKYRSYFAIYCAVGAMVTFILLLITYFDTYLINPPNTNFNITLFCKPSDQPRPKLPWFR